jgi:hypothetical protein
MNGEDGLSQFLDHWFKELSNRRNGRPITDQRVHSAPHIDEGNSMGIRVGGGWRFRPLSWRVA